MDRNKFYNQFNFINTQSIDFPKKLQSAKFAIYLKFKPLNKIYFQSNYNKIWVDYYTKNNLGRIDPIMNLENQNCIFMWDEITIKKSNSMKLLSSRDFDIKQGVTYVSNLNPDYITYSCDAHEYAIIKNSKNAQKYFENHSKLLIYDSIIKIKSNLNLLHVLSQREVQCLAWAAHGKTNYAIAIILNLSENTIKSYFKNIFNKLAVENKNHAIFKAVKLGII
jgi:LuxR family transcriptional regulator, quorum-sensing system regulator CciR